MRLLITGAWADAEQNIPALEKRGHEIVFLPWEQDELPCQYDWPEGVICNGLFLHHPIERFTSLRFIQLTSAGFDRVPMDYVREHEIEIHNARGVYSIPMAEFAVCGVLQLYKQSRFFQENQKAHRWEKHRGLLELYGKTVLIVGCGSVGTECAKRFKAFGCRVIVVNRTVRDSEWFDLVIPMDCLDDALTDADVVVLSISLTDQTRYLMDANRLSRLKPGAVLVNISRGALVDTDVLQNALPNLGGAVLDVFEEEPLPEDNPLWDKENVIVTPHNSFVGDGNEERLAGVIIEYLSNGDKEWKRL